MASTDRVISVDLDESTLVAADENAAHERRVAIFDLLEENFFLLNGVDGGPYAIKLSLIEQKLVFQVNSEAGEELKTFILSLMPMRRVIKDYFAICMSYNEAIRSASPQQIEAIDMGRRGLHDEGAELLQQRFEGKIETDYNTARRLFTLICALHQKGGRI